MLHTSIKILPTNLVTHLKQFVIYFTNLSGNFQTKYLYFFSEDEIEKAPTMLSLAKEKTSLEKKLSNNEKNNEIVGNDNFSITVIEEADNNVEHIESHKGPCTPPQNNHESLDLAKGPQTPEGIKFSSFLL